MARLPNVGSDTGAWGTLLNEFLRVSHGEDGATKGVLGVHNVLDFGATADGTTDDTDAIQAAIDAAGSAGGGLVFFPPGNYMTTSTLTCAVGGIVLFGAGHSSVIRPKGNFDTVLFAAPGNAYIYGNKIMDLLFEESQKTGGLTLNGQYVAQFHAMRVYAGSGWNGWLFHNFNNVTLDHCSFVSYRGDYYARATGGGAGAGKGRSDALRLYSLVFGGERKSNMIGLDIDGFVHTVNGWGIHFVNIGGRGLHARNSLGAENDPSFFTFDDLECDYPDLECVRLDAGQRFYFNNAQLNGTRGPAANIYIGPAAKGVSFTGGFSCGAQQAGITVDGRDVTISAMHFFFNSSNEFGGAKNAFPGILLGMACKDVVVTGCRSGQEATQDYQSYGCQVDTTADGFVIVGNDFRYNVNPGVNNGSGIGLTKVIANNI